MSGAPVIEMLFPEVANLHGDNVNIDYLHQCRPDARVIRTALNEEPSFLTQKVDLLYLGPSTEKAQLVIVDRLRPYAAQLRDRIESDAVTLFTHNAFEVLGQRIRNDGMGYDVAGVGLFDIESTLDMMGRFNGKVIGVVPEVGSEHPVVGYKSQFSMVTGGETLPGFLTADRGIGRNTRTSVEGVRVGNFFGTSLIGPLLVMNPYFLKALLAIMDPESEPKLAHEEMALLAYNSRLRQFGEDQRWHRAEEAEQR